MFLKINRLTKKRDFEEVFLKGRLFQSSGLSVRFFSNNLNQSRLGLIVGIKVSKKAIVRNRIRRQLREIVRGKTDRIKPGFDVILIAKKKINDKSFKEIKEELNSLIKKTNLCD